MMKNKFGVTGVSTPIVLATLAACGGGGGGAAVPPPAPKVWGTASLIETESLLTADFGAILQGF